MNANLQRALISLKGLAVGDAYGAQYWEARAGRPCKPWPWSDDTAMAQALVEVLARHGEADRDDLAQAFVKRWQAQPNRGYGPNTVKVLSRIASGMPWHLSTVMAVAGQKPGWLARLLRGEARQLGSYGNGAAMRVAPLGAYFADDLDACAWQAVLSAEVTHAHPDGVAGAVAVAVAAALASRGVFKGPVAWPRLLGHVRDMTTRGAVRSGLGAALACHANLPASEAAKALGNGSDITAANTVPFALWCATRHLDDYHDALEEAVSVGGDSDTICAIVGGVVACAVGAGGVPTPWLDAAEPLELKLPENPFDSAH